MGSHARFRVLLLPLCGVLASCGGGGGGGGSGGGGGNPFQPGTTWQAGVFQPRSNFDNMCANPRPGTVDRQGTKNDENNFLRSWTNELYLCFIPKGAIRPVIPPVFLSKLNPLLSLLYIEKG